MSVTPTQLSTFAFEKEKNISVNFRHIINNYKHYWYIFLITIAASIFVAFLYLQYAEPLYEVKASLLIRQDKSSTTQQQSVLDKIDLPNSPEVTENEIAKLKSTNLIGQVVNDLQLSTIYKIKNGWTYKEIYGELPFRLVTIRANPGYDGVTRELDITIKSPDSFVYKNDDGNLETHSFGTNITSPFGTWKLLVSPDINEFKNKAVKVTLLDPDKVTLAYQKAIDVSLEDKLASAIDLTIDDHIKQRGKDILNRLIYIYDNAEVQQKNKETQSTIDFIDKRLESLTGELTNAEKNVASFKSSNQLTNIDADSQYNLDNLQANNAKLNDVEVQLGIINGIEDYINNPQNKGKVPAVIGISDATLVSSIEKLSQLELQREQLLATTPETNPDFEQLNRQIQATRSAIKENVKNIKSSLLNAQSKMQSVNSHVESTITGIPMQEREYGSIKRQQAIKENLYVYLLQKREEVSLNYATTVKNYEVLDNAYSGPLKWPDKNIIYLALFAFGLIAAMVIIFIKDKIDNVIVNAEDIEDEIKVPVLMDINKGDGGQPIVISGKGSVQNSNLIITEQFRALRSKLHAFINPDEQSRIILVTSSTAEEGKSFIASNLGISMASSGKKTIILDLDLRRPKLSEIFQLPKTHKGITDFLKKDGSINEIIQPSGVIPHLDIISAGTISSNSSELLESEQLNQLMTHLKNNYYNIIIDSPPLHLVSDAFIFSRLASITLYIIRQGFTKKAELRFIKNLYADGAMPQMNIIFNGVDNRRYGYGYDHSHNYYLKPQLNAS